MKKQTEYIYAHILVHPHQARIVDLFRAGLIDPNKDSLRDIAKKALIEPASAQMAKHHLERLVQLGIFDMVGGQYILHKNP